MIYLKSAHQNEPLPLRLQRAIELEHSTIPTYLYSLYSLQESNPVIGSIILSVVLEEMLHFGLACNILNAIDGAPVINRPDFIPAYPGPLPGSIDCGLIVHLKRFSLDHVYDTFMKIEEPETPLRFSDCPDVSVAAEPVALAASLDVQGAVTIGEYYTQIKNDIIAAGPGIFTGKLSRQVDGPLGVTKVETVDDAVQAIETIIDQGEGTTKSPLDSDQGITEFAHYYRFSEIWHGKELAPKNGTAADPQYCYDAAKPVPFDPTGVLPVIADPKTSRYPTNTQAHYLNNNFNYAYTSLLKGLHLTFNGQPGQLESSIGLMHSMRELAMAMMTEPFSNEGNAGPSFEYQPVNL